jgi:hypothetical protein
MPYKTDNCRYTDKNVSVMPVMSIAEREKNFSMKMHGSHCRHYRLQ